MKQHQHKTKGRNGHCCRAFAKKAFRCIQGVVALGFHETDNTDSLTKPLKDDSSCTSLYSNVSEKDGKSQRIGKRIGKYKLWVKLGEGGFGYVYSATKRASTKRLAIKCIPRTSQSVHESIQEATIMRDMGKHPNIAGLKDAMCSPECFYIVMPRAQTNMVLLYNNDHTLFRKQPDLLQQAMKGVLMGLKHLHENGVAHLDVKPEQIFVFSSAIEDNRLEPGKYLDSSCFKLTDFGLARLSPNYGQSVAVDDNELPPEHVIAFKNNERGTATYMAPEMAFRHCSDGRRADIWSFGLMLCVMRGHLTDHMDKLEALIDGGQSSEYFTALGEFVMALKESTTRCREQQLLKDLLVGLLTIDPAKRLTASQALHHPWFGCQLQK